MGDEVASTAIHYNKIDYRQLKTFSGYINDGKMGGKNVAVAGSC